MRVAVKEIKRRGRGVLKDISAQQGMESILRSEYQAIFNNNGKPMMVIEADTTISLVNAEFEELCGYTKEEVEGKKRWTDFAVMGDRKRAREYQRLRERDPMMAPRCFEFQFLNRQGNIKNTVLTIGMIVGTNKSMASLVDVTERRLTESMLRANEDRYRVFFERASDAVYIAASDGAIVDVNQVALDLFGYTREEMRQINARQLYAHPEDAREFWKKIREGGVVRDLEVTLRTKDGREVYCLITGAARRADDERILEYQCIIRDVTKRKREEEELKRHRDDLEELVKERTTELEAANEHLRREITERRRAEEKLRQSEDKLEKLHAVASRLAACASEEEVYQEAVDAAKVILTFSFCSLGMVEGNQIVTKVADPQPFIDENQARPINEGLAGTTYRHKKTHVLREIRKGVKFLAPESQYLSLVSAPIADLGVFQAASIEPHAFTKDDTRLLEMLLGHTGAAIKRIRLQNELKEQAIHDSLTGLYNRYYLDKVLDQEVKRSRRYRHRIAFLMIDVNRFKEINDRYGHQIGDEILKEVASLLCETVRGSDSIVRYGGDEFLIMLPETNGDVDSVKRRLADNMALSNKNNSERMDFPVTLSVGSAIWDPKEHKSVDEVLNEADKRMYEDKKRRNGYVKEANRA